MLQGRSAAMTMMLLSLSPLLWLGIAQSQATPNAPPASNEQTTPSAAETQTQADGNLSGRNRNMPLNAVHATIHMSQAAMVKARNWEASWLTGVYVEKGHTMLPLTLPERRELFLQQTLATPGAYTKRMFAAGIDQARGVPGDWGGGMQGYGKRFASREGQFISANTMAFLGNAALRYEPRYDQCQCSGFWLRSRHAILRNFLTYNQSEQLLRPQLALYGGSFGGGILSSTWKPQPRNAFAE